MSKQRDAAKDPKPSHHSEHDVSQEAPLPAETHWHQFESGRGLSSQPRYSSTQLIHMQRQLGNKLTRRYLQRYQDAQRLGRALQPMHGHLQREEAPTTQVNWVPRAPVVWQRSGESSDGRMSWAVKGNAEFPDQAPDKPAPEIKVAELQTTLNNGAREFSSAIAKYSEPLEGLNDFFGIPGITFSIELAALEAVAKEMENGVEVDFNAIKVAIKGQGKLDQNSVQSDWAKVLLGNAALYDSVLAGQMALALELEFSVGLKAEDVLRLVRIAQAHRQLLKMSVQNKAWMQRLAQMADKGSAKARRLLRRMIAKNKALATKLVAHVMPQTLRLAAGLVGRSLLKLVPILNAYFLAQDVYAVVETLYGILSGKGYRFGIADSVDKADADANASESNEGEPSGEGTGEGSSEATGEAMPEWLQGVEDEAAGGGAEFQAAELHPNAQAIVTALRGRGFKLDKGDKNILNQAIPAELDNEQMQALLQMVKKAKPSQEDVFSVLGKWVEYVQHPPVSNQTEASDQQGQGSKDNGSDIHLEGGDTATGQLGTEQGGDGSGIRFEDEVVKGQGGGGQGSDINFEDEVVQGNGNAPDNADNPEFDYDFEIRDFMKRAFHSMKKNPHLKGYSEIEPVAFNSLEIDSRFEGMVTVYMGLPEVEWVGGRAKFRVLKKHPNGQLDVERDAMPAYSKHGKYVGVLQSQVILVGLLPDG